MTGAGLSYTWGSWWAVPWFVIHGMLLNDLLAAQHECNRYPVFRTRWLNDVVNRITGFVPLYPSGSARNDLTLLDAAARRSREFLAAGEYRVTTNRHPGALARFA